MEISITLKTSADSLAIASVLFIGTEIMVGVPTSEVDGGQLQRSVTLGALLMLKVDGGSLHGDSLKLNIHNLVSDLLDLTLLLLNRLGLSL